MCVYLLIKGGCGLFDGVYCNVRCIFINVSIDFAFYGGEIEFALRAFEKKYLTVHKRFRVELTNKTPRHAYDHFSSGVRVYPPMWKDSVSTFLHEQ